jgi:hypothetical protein
MTTYIYTLLKIDVPNTDIKKEGIRVLLYTLNDIWNDLRVLHDL